MASVYIIKNKVNDTYLYNKPLFRKPPYQSVEARFLRHINDSKKKNLKQVRVLYSAMNKYGIDNFYVEELESDLTDKEACEKEVYYINKYRSFIKFNDCNGYNMTPGGDGHRYSDYNEIINAFIKNNYDKKKTAKELHCTRRTVLRACKEFGLESNPENMPKKVDMYAKGTGALLRTFPTKKVAREYIKSILGLSGYSLREKGVFETSEYIFRVRGV